MRRRATSGRRGIFARAQPVTGPVDPIHDHLLPMRQENPKWLALEVLRGLSDARWMRREAEEALAAVFHRGRRAGVPVHREAMCGER